ncbi:MAG: aconitase X swivel domain-containing protein [Alphaproteobacteria bacterium]
MAKYSNPRILVAGEARGALLRLAAPISFWGGVDAATGRIVDPRHPDHGASVAGSVLAIEATIGSSSSSAVMLELLRIGKAPAALLLGQIDAILTLGVIVAGEMGYPCIPVLAITAGEIAALPVNGTPILIEDGKIAPL